MRKVLSLILTVVMVFALALSVTGCSTPKTDYKGPVAAVDAMDNGDNIVGKTILVTANMDYTALLNNSGMIYTYTDMAPRQIMVCPNGGTGTNVHNGDEVVFRITNVDTNRPGTFVLEGTVVE